MSGPERRFAYTLLVLRSESRTDVVSITVVAMGVSSSSQNLNARKSGRTQAEDWVIEIDALGCLNQRVLWGSDFLKNRVRVFQRFIDRKRVHLPSMLITARFNEIPEIMAGYLDGKRIGNNAASPPVIFHPCRVRQRNPYWMPRHQEFDVYGIGVARSDSNDEGLVQAVQFLAGPAVGNVEVFVHSR